MTRADLAALIAELLDKPPGERPRLLNAMLDANSHAHPPDPRDAFAGWLRACLMDTTEGQAGFLGDPERLFEVLDLEEVPHAPPPESIAAYRQSEAAVPADDVIRQKIRSVFEQIDR